MRLNAGAASRLYDLKRVGLENTGITEDAVLLSSDGLVRQAVSFSFPFSNGAFLMPNTFMMQELVRSAVDQYTDDVDHGFSIECPVVFTIPKGTPLPNSLALVREHTSRFSLQPYEPTLLSALNECLTEFYSKYGEMQTAEEWIDGHEFTSAHADDAEREWMAE